MSLTEIVGDLFNVSQEYSLAHCVSRDLRMGKGIASRFKNLFGGVETLKAQNPRIGFCCSLEIGPNRFAYYLVTKERYFHKPTYYDLERSLESLIQHCQISGIGNLAIPKIGCGLDKLDWRRVREMVERILCGAGINVLVVYL